MPEVQFHNTGHHWGGEQDWYFDTDKGEVYGLDGKDNKVDTFKISDVRARLESSSSFRNAGKAEEKNGLNGTPFEGDNFRVVATDKDGDDKISDDELSVFITGKNGKGAIETKEYEIKGGKWVEKKPADPNAKPPAAKPEEQMATTFDVNTGTATTKDGNGTIISVTGLGEEIKTMATDIDDGSDNSFLTKHFETKTVNLDGGDGSKAKAEIKLVDNNMDGVLSDGDTGEIVITTNTGDTKTYELDMSGGTVKWTLKSGGGSSTGPGNPTTPNTPNTPNQQGQFLDIDRDGVQDYAIGNGVYQLGNRNIPLNVGPQWTQFADVIGPSGAPDGVVDYAYRDQNGFVYVMDGRAAQQQQLGPVQQQNPFGNFNNGGGLSNFNTGSNLGSLFSSFMSGGGWNSGGSSFFGNGGGFGGGNNNGGWSVAQAPNGQTIMMSNSRSNMPPGTQYAVHVNGQWVMATVSSNGQSIIYA